MTRNHPSRWVFDMDKFFWTVPLILFVLATVFDSLGIKIGIPPRTISTLGEVSFSIWLVTAVKSRLPQKLKYLLLVPIGFALGDFAYGFNHYIFRFVYNDAVRPLTYAVPYVVGMIAAVYALTKFCKQTKDPRVTLAMALGLSTLTFILNWKVIITPSIFHKTPALPATIASLTVIFSVLESWIVGFSAILLVLTSNYLVQSMLFGLLIMNISDIAMRYQSVYTNLVGMTIFENGWFLGLALMVIPTVLAVKRSDNDVKEALSEFLRLYSIRAMTVGFILIGISIVWVAVSFYFKAIQLPTEVSATLLIALGVFGFAIVTANIVNQGLSKITFRLTSDRSLLRQDFPRHMPEEIETIVRYFQKLGEKTLVERDHALSLSSTMAHNIKSPVGALKMARFKLAKHISNGCECCKELQEQVGLLQVSSETIDDISNQLLEEKKRLVGVETVASSIKKAVTLAAANHPRNKIKVDVTPKAEITPISGLNSVLTNLINNAAEASIAGQPIVLKAKVAGTRVVVTVADEGKGMPVHVLEHLRSGREITTKLLGNGIGVSSTYAWAKQRGYDVFLDSSNKGTAVSISIPADLWINDSTEQPNIEGAT